jgi:predicted RNA-binding protein with PUA-like domain|tara:strand:- start:406 stop:819 length:414 start_codon:yes stop_codon:yes gene_type:complete
MAKSYFLLKSEPNTWSWNDQIKDKIAMWDGVRNYQARNILMSMRVNDLCFFYHSVNERKIVGIVSVTKEHYTDPTDKTKKFVAVDVKTKKSLKNPVTLKQIKKEKRLSHLGLVRQSRLSVMPIDKISWDLICKLGGI